jgi:hypothetical protein
MYEDDVWYSSDGNITYGSGMIDEFDKPIKKTPSKYPYSYDGYITHRAGENKEANGTIYTDRLNMWDHKKCHELKQKHFGNQSDYWSDFSPDQIEAFLRDWCDDQELKLIFVMQYCNVSNGYPLWRLEFKQ